MCVKGRGVTMFSLCAPVSSFGRLRCIKITARVFRFCDCGVFVRGVRRGAVDARLPLRRALSLSANSTAPYALSLRTVPLATARIIRYIYRVISHTPREHICVCAHDTCVYTHMSTSLCACARHVCMHICHVMSRVCGPGRGVQL